jgi:uncharacterized membrane protein YqjE
MDRIDTVRRERHPNGRGNGTPLPERPQPDGSIGDLLKQLTADASLLVQQEVALAKEEARESLKTAGRAAVGFAVAAVLALAGVMALSAFLVVVLAEVTDSWWVATLGVGVLLLAAAGLLVQRARSAMARGSMGLPATAESLARDAAWGKSELRAFKEELTA